MDLQRKSMSDYVSDSFTLTFPVVRITIKNVPIVSIKSIRNSIADSKIYGNTRLII